MEPADGNPESPLWLLGDSPPAREKQVLAGVPLDRRHPSRHNIWTPICDRIQNALYSFPERLRLDERKLYIRNAVYDQCEWSQPNILADRSCELARLMGLHSPKVVISFGQKSYGLAESAVKLMRSDPHLGFNLESDCEELGKEFCQAINSFDASKINVIPLLHVSIARGNSVAAHRKFTGEPEKNYFDFVGDQLGQLFCKHSSVFSVLWVS
jgi:hypothetical protein